MTDDAVPARGSLRSRGAALVSALTLRRISAVLPPEQAWGQANGVDAEGKAG